MAEGRSRAVGLAAVALCLSVVGCRSQGITKAEAQRRADGAKRAATEGFAQLWPGLQGVAKVRFAPYGNFAQCTDQGGDVKYIALATFDPPTGSTPVELAQEFRHVLEAAGWRITPGVGPDTSDAVQIGGESGDLVAAVSAQRDTAFVRVLSPCVAVGKHDDVGFEGAKDLELP